MQYQRCGRSGIRLSLIFRGCGRTAATTRLFPRVLCFCTVFGQWITHFDLATYHRDQPYCYFFLSTRLWPYSKSPDPITN